MKFWLSISILSRVQMEVYHNSSSQTNVSTLSTILMSRLCISKIVGTVKNPSTIKERRAGTKSNTYPNGSNGKETLFLLKRVVNIALKARF